MTITVTPKLEKALSEEARKQGTTPERLALDRLSDFFVPEEQESEEVAEGSAYDLFEGLIGRSGSRCTQPARSLSICNCPDSNP